MSDAASPIQLDLPDAGVRLRVKLPAGWIWEPTSKPARASRDGAVTRRFAARSDGGNVRIYIGATHLPLPAGLMPAVVYWCSLYGLDVPDAATQWGAREAFFTRASAGPGYICMVWFRVADCVIEVRIEAATGALCEASAEWLLRDFECEPIQSAIEGAPGREPWWIRVQKLREAGSIEEALAVAERDGDRAEALLVQAELHAERMHRAQAEGQVEIAREAWRKATGCVHAYAASATSGGEGAARSVERDRLLARLGGEPT
jgi:hypothetical protein